ncbi:DivIVA domain-containing protein [Arthrobacter sp. TWP1-1]|uniref:DivIVA domain-containing protein n=1 Tax=Arthrobacter sp. TWP1-1 TaxID=2804568 RepID=UPI003CE969EC
MKSSEIATTKFSTTKFREGYSMPEVDAFLDDIRGSLTAWESGRPGPVTAAAVAEARFPMTKFRAGYDQDQVDTFLDEAAAALKEFESGVYPTFG